MKTHKFLGIIFILVGSAISAYKRITYTTREKVVDLGPLKITTEKTTEQKKTLPRLLPVTGVLTLLSGFLLLLMRKKKLKNGNNLLKKEKK